MPTSRIKVAVVGYGNVGRCAVESILVEQGEVVIRNEMCNHEYRFDRDAVETLFA